jgi:hypothetical protein
MDMNEKSGITNGWRTPVKLLKRKRERERERETETEKKSDILQKLP